MKRFYPIFLLVITTVLAHAQSPPPGTLDSSFGVNGVVIDSFTDGRSMKAFDAVLQKNNRIITIGTSINRYLPNGKPDLLFGDNGQLNLHGGKIELRDNGTIVALCNDPQDVFLVQIDSTGKIDPSFGVNGITQLDFEEIQTSRLLKDGSILVAGATDGLVLMKKVTPGGFIDSSFGTNGSVQVPNGLYAGNVAGIDTLSDGRIALAGIGYTPQKTRSAMLMRFLRNGTPDSSFGIYGRIYHFPASYCWHMALQKGGKTLAAFGNIFETAMVRFNTDGSIDPTYGQGGMFTLPYRVRDFELLDSGKILCAGSDGDFVISKLRPEGAGVDSSFGINGTARTVVTTNSYDGVASMALQSDGKIIVAGESRAKADSWWDRLTLVRYHGTPPPPTEGIGYVWAEMPTLHPNPASSSLSLSGIVPALYGSPYQITTPTGQVVLRGTLPIATSHTIAVASLPPGLYYLRLPAATLPFLRQ